MKRVILVVLLAVGALMTYNYTKSGKFTLLPPGPVTGEEQELRRLEKDFDTASKEFNQALRSAGLGGLDTTSDAEAAMNEVRRIERRLNDLEPRLVRSDLRKDASRLRYRVTEFKRKAGA